MGGKLSGMARRAAVAGAIAATAALFAFGAGAQAPGGRSLDELKAEAQARADRNAYPLTGLKPDDVSEALAGVQRLDRDEWAASWSRIGDRYMEHAQQELAANPAAADRDFLQAWLTYSFARWPVPNSPGKEAAYQKALAAYLAHARLMDPPLEVVRIPFEGSQITAYLRLPKGAAGPVPLVVAISGLDSRKEDMAERFSAMLPHGVGFLAVDSPGTGQAPVKVVPGAERMLVRAIDAALARSEVDKSRVAIYGGSFGAYWSTLLAATEKNRVRAVVAQSPPAHEAFTRARTMALSSNREYLFDYVPAQLFTYGANTLEELADDREKISLKAEGILDKPMAPMLVIGGVHDTQVPIADIDLLLNSGTTPKEAWINPQGGHMGRDAHSWPDPVIFDKITMPWLLRALGLAQG